jgi:hypothetical protein
MCISFATDVEYLIYTSETTSSKTSLLKVQCGKVGYLEPMGLSCALTPDVSKREVKALAATNDAVTQLVLKRHLRCPQNVLDSVTTAFSAFY